MSLYSPGSMVTVHKSITFTGAAGLGLAGTAVPMFTVTGEVLIVAIVGVCTVDLTEAAPTATIALGVTGNTALFIAATTSTGVDAGEFWVSTTPTANGIALPAAVKDVAITDDVVITPATQNTNGGSIRLDVVYIPLSVDGSVVAA